MKKFTDIIINFTKKRPVLSRFIKCYLIIQISIFIGLIAFYFYLNSSYVSNDYVAEKSSCGNWSVILMPDTYGELMSVLVYEGDSIESVEEIYIEALFNNDEPYQYELKGEDMLMSKKFLDIPFATVAGKQVLKDKYHCYIMGTVKPNATLNTVVTWKQDGKLNKTEMEVSYDKVNLYHIYTEIWYYLAWGWLIPRGW